MVAGEKRAQRFYNCTDGELCTQVDVFCSYADSRQAALLAADPDLTPAWWAGLRQALAAALRLPPLGVRQATAAEARQLRNEALAAAHGLQHDLFFYAPKAYPGVPRASDLFGHRLFTAARGNLARRNAALQAAAVEVPARRAALEAAGMPATALDALLTLADTAQRTAVTTDAQRGQGSVATATTVRTYNALWQRLQQINRAAGVAFRSQPATKALFRLAPPGPALRRLTAKAATAAGPGRRVVRLPQAPGAGRTLSVRVQAPGGPVRVALVLLKTDAPAPGLLLATTLPGKRHRVLASALGPDHAPFLLLENETSEPATIEVRVLPV